MNVQQEAVALYLFLEERGFRPSVRSVSDCLRRQRLKFRESVVREALECFIKSRDASQTQLGRNEDATGTQKTSTRDAVPTQSGRSADATGTRLRAHSKVSLVSKPLGSLRSPTAEPAKKSEPRRIGLPFDAQVESRKREILNAVWAQLAPKIGSVIGKTEWTRRNGRVARDLAELNRTPEECVQAWHAASARLAAPVRMLSIVQDQLVRDAMPVAAAELNSSDRLPVFVCAEPGEKVADVWEQMRSRMAGAAE